MRLAALVVYTIVFSLSLALMIASFLANSHRVWLLLTGNTAFTFVFMVLFSALSIYWQDRLKNFSPLLLIQCGIVGGLLFFSALFHTFTDISSLLGWLHIGIAIIFATWNLQNYRKNESAKT